MRPRGFVAPARIFLCFDLFQFSLRCIRRGVKGPLLLFQVISQNTGEQVGRISRHLIAQTHLSVKTVSPEEDYNVSFSKDLPVAMKAVFLAAVFLLVSFPFPRPLAYRKAHVLGSRFDARQRRLG